MALEFGSELDALRLTAGRGGSHLAREQGPYLDVKRGGDAAESRCFGAPVVHANVY